MAMMTVELSEPLKSWIERKARADGFASAGDYLRDLARRDREKVDAALSIEEVSSIVADARASGISERTLDDIFSEALGQAKFKSGQ